MFTIETDTDLKIVRYRHSGNITREDLGKAWAELLQNKEFVNLRYDLLTDYRNADFVFSMDETGVMWDFLCSIQHILDGKKEAVITDQPNSTAISMFFEEKIYSEIGFYVKVFSTEEAALHWLSF